MDTVIIKTMNEAGAITGLRLILGLFTQDSYTRLPHEIPVLRQKVRRCHERSGFAADGRDGKALQHILDNFPRDELFQIDETQLFDTAIGILHLQQRPRVALFAMRDPFERFVTCLVYLPRDRVNAEVTPPHRRHRGAVLRRPHRRAIHAFRRPGAGAAAFRHRHAGANGGEDVPAIERRLTEALRTWADRLSETLIRQHGKRRGGRGAAPLRDRVPVRLCRTVSVETAVRDMADLDAVAAGAQSRCGWRRRRASNCG